MVDSFDQLKTHLDQTIWTVSPARDNPTLEDAPDPAATEDGIDAEDVAEVIGALFRTELSELGFEPAFSRAREEIDAGRPLVWARRQGLAIHLIRLHHRSGYCSGSEDLSRAVMPRADQFDVPLNPD